MLARSPPSVQPFAATSPQAGRSVDHRRVPGPRRAGTSRVRRPWSTVHRVPSPGRRPLNHLSGGHDVNVDAVKRRSGGSRIAPTGRLTAAGIGRTERSLAAEAHDYWSRSDTGNWVSDSHWRDAPVFAGGDPGPDRCTASGDGRPCGTCDRLHPPVGTRGGVGMRRRGQRRPFRPTGERVRRCRHHREDPRRVRSAGYGRVRHAVETGPGRSADPEAVARGRALRSLALLLRVRASPIP